MSIFKSLSALYTHFGPHTYTGCQYLKASMHHILILDHLPTLDVNILKPLCTIYSFWTTYLHWMSIFQSLYALYTHFGPPTYTGCQYPKASMHYILILDHLPTLDVNILKPLCTIYSFWTTYLHWMSIF
jgi:hypothetical protein